MGFYSELLGSTVDSIYFNSEEQAYKTAMALYIGETYPEASRFSTGIEREPYQYNPSQNFVRGPGTEFVLAVFKREVRNEFDDGTVIKDRYFPSSFVKYLYDQAYKEVKEYLDANPYNKYEEFMDEILDALAAGENTISGSDNKNDRELVNKVVSEVKDLIKMIIK